MKSYRIYLNSRSFMKESDFWKMIWGRSPMQCNSDCRFSSLCTNRTCDWPHCCWAWLHCGCGSLSRALTDWLTHCWLSQHTLESKCGYVYTFPEWCLRHESLLVVFILTSTRGVCRASESTALICEDLSNRTGFEVVKWIIGEANHLLPFLPPMVTYLFV